MKPKILSLVIQLFLAAAAVVCNLLTLADEKGYKIIVPVALGLAVLSLASGLRILIGGPWLFRIPSLLLACPALWVIQDAVLVRLPELF